jgi:hypothetical protein
MNIANAVKSAPALGARAIYPAGPLGGAGKSGPTASQLTGGLQMPAKRIQAQPYNQDPDSGPIGPIGTDKYPVKEIEVTSGMTYNGRKPIPGWKVYYVGQGSYAMGPDNATQIGSGDMSQPAFSGGGSQAAQSTPKAAQLTQLQQKDQPPGAGARILAPGQRTVGDIAAVSTQGEVQRNSEGTSYEAQKKRLASKMYPSSRGLRAYQGPL